MIANNVHLYTWVDIQDVISLAQQQHDWPESLVWARTYWDGLALGIRPGTQQEVLSWLADKFGSRFCGGQGPNKGANIAPHILLESVSGKSRQLEVFLEETEETPRQSRYSPRLARPSVLWPPHETRGYPAPLPENLPPVVAFHSFNGEGEQTLLSIALANALLVKRPTSRVLLIDGDIEAPRLSWLLRLTNATGSLADFFSLVHSDPDETGTESIQLVAERLKELLLDGVYVLPAFRLDKRFAPLDVKPWHFIQGVKDPFALTTMLARLGQSLDVQAVIVDLRSGLSELSAWLLLDPRVYRVLVTSLSGPAIEGTRYLLELLAEVAPVKHKHEPLPALMVTTKTTPAVETSSQDMHHAAGSRATNQSLEPLKSLLRKKVDGPTDLLVQKVEFDSKFTTLPNEWSEVTNLISASNLIEQMQPLVDWLPHPYQQGASQKGR